MVVQETIDEINNELIKLLEEVDEAERKNPEEFEMAMEAVEETTHSRYSRYSRQFRRLFSTVRKYYRLYSGDEIPEEKIEKLGALSNELSKDSIDSYKEVADEAGISVESTEEVVRFEEKAGRKGGIAKRIAAAIIGGLLGVAKLGVFGFLLSKAISAFTFVTSVTWAESTVSAVFIGIVILLLISLIGTTLYGMIKGTVEAVEEVKNIDGETVDKLTNALSEGKEILSSLKDKGDVKAMKDFLNRHKGLIDEIKKVGKR